MPTSADADAGGSRVLVCHTPARVVSPAAGQVSEEEMVAAVRTALNHGGDRQSPPPHLLAQWSESHALQPPAASAS